MWGISHAPRSAFAFTWILAASLVAATWSSAGAAPPTVEHLTQPTTFERISVERGLPQNHVTAIAQDGEGFLWMGTDGGLARYDGHRFRSFLAEDVDGLETDEIAALVTDADGRVWIGTALGLIVYDPTTASFTAFAGDDDGLRAVPVLALGLDRDGRVLVGTADERGVVRIEPATGAYESFALPGGVPTDFVSTTDGALFITTSGAGLARLDAGGKVKLVDDLPSAELTAVASPDGGKTLFIGTADAGVIEYAPGRGIVRRFRADITDPSALIDDRISSIFVDSAGALWVGSHSGLHQRSKGATGFLRHLTDYDNWSSLPYPRVDAIFEDSVGGVWFGTLGGGAGRYDRIVAQLNLRHIPVSSFAMDAKGNVIGGSSPGHIAWRDEEAQTVTTWTELTSPSGETLDMTPYWASCMHHSRGLLYVCLQGAGLLVFDRGSGDFVLNQFDPDDPASLPSNSVFWIEEAADGKLWLATWGGGAARYDPETGEFRSFGTQTGTALPSDYLYTVHIDERDPRYVWLGMAEGGLVRLDSETGEVAGNEELTGTSVTSIYEDEDHVLWLATWSDGLARFDPEANTVEWVRRDDGLSTDRLLGVLGDDAGNLWISTNGGGLLRYHRKTGDVRVFGSTDGSVANFAQSSYMAAPNGHLYFGSTVGYIHFDPESIKPRPEPPPVRITAIEVGGEDFSSAKPPWFPQSIDLPYSESLVTIEFSALSFVPEGQIRYAYRLDGFIDEWVETTEPRVTLRLPDGDFQFEVRARAPDSEWNEAQVGLTFDIAPPLWRSWWAFLAYFLALLGVALGFVRYQRQRLREAERDQRLASVEMELELTGAVQSGFLPLSDSSRLGALALQGVYEPADVCSGDWWWYDADGSRLTIIVGDVTGHGPGPAMVTAGAATAYRVASGGSTQSVIEVMNREVLRVGGGKYQMTLTAVDIDTTTGAYVVYCAGGLPPLSLTDAGTRAVVARGTPLGTQNFDLGTITGQLSPRERMLVCTDGVPEITLKNGRLLGMRRLSKLFESSRTMQVDDVAPSIVREAAAMAGEGPQEDDWTLVVLEWDGAGLHQGHAAPGMPPQPRR